MGCGSCGNDSCYNSCFADTSKIFVKTDEGDVIRKQLRGVKVGDKVQSVDPKTGELVFSKVVFMDHDDDPNPWQEVLKFSYHDGKDEVELCTTPNHLIYASESAERMPLKNPILAYKIKVGDYFWVLSSDGDGLEPRQVTAISEDMQKILNPVTQNHHIVVEKVHASTHVGNEKHYRIGANIFRFLYALNPKINISKPLKKFNGMINYKKADVPAPPTSLEIE